MLQLPAILSVVDPESRKQLIVKDTAEYLHAMGKLDQRGNCSGFVTSGLCGTKVKHILSDEKGF